MNLKVLSAHNCSCLIGIINCFAVDHVTRQMNHHIHLQEQKQNGQTWRNCVNEIIGIKSGQRCMAQCPSVIMFGVSYIIPEKLIVVDWPVSLILYVD